MRWVFYIFLVSQLFNFLGVFAEKIKKDLSELNNKKGKLMDLRMELTGAISLNYADVFSGSPPSVQRRLGSMSWELYNTTSKQTKTHESTLNISIKKYEDILDRFKKL